MWGKTEAAWAFTGSGQENLANYNFILFSERSEWWHLWLLTVQTVTKQYVSSYGHHSPGRQKVTLTASSDTDPTSGL